MSLPLFISVGLKLYKKLQSKYLLCCSTSYYVKQSLHKKVVCREFPHLVATLLNQYLKLLALPWMT